MSVKLLTECHLECLSLEGGCTGSSVSTFVKMPHCWKSHVKAQLCVVGAQSHLDSSFKHPKHMFKLMDKKESQLHSLFFNLA